MVVQQGGFTNLQILNFCKYVLGVRRNVCNYKIYSELGRQPLIMQWKLKIMKYWCKLLKVENCILKSSYGYLRVDAENRVSSCMNWARNVKRELFPLSLGEFWKNVPLFLTVYKSIIWEIHIQKCHSFFFNFKQILFYSNTL